MFHIINKTKAFLSLFCLATLGGSIAAGQPPQQVLIYPNQYPQQQARFAAGQQPYKRKRSVVKRVVVGVLKGIAMIGTFVIVSLLDEASKFKSGEQLLDAVNNGRYEYRSSTKSDECCLADKANAAWKGSVNFTNTLITSVKKRGKEVPSNLKKLWSRSTDE
jgi:hypothetical protein